MVIVGAVALLVGVTLYTERSQPQLTITFVGYTNIAGAKHVLVRIPAIKKPPLPKFLWRNFFWKTFYRLRIYFETENENGSIRRADYITVEDDFAIERDIPLPLSNGEKSLKITESHVVLERPWDNVSMPFSLPQRRWVFRLPPPQELPSDHP